MRFTDATSKDGFAALDACENNVLAASAIPNRSSTPRLRLYLILSSDWFWLKLRISFFIDPASIVKVCFFDFI